MTAVRQKCRDCNLLHDPDDLNVYERCDRCQGRFEGKNELCYEIDELCQQGLNSPDAAQWEACLHDILAVVRRR